MACLGAHIRPTSAHAVYLPVLIASGEALQLCQLKRSLGAYCRRMMCSAWHNEPHVIVGRRFTSAYCIFSRRAATGQPLKRLYDVASSFYRPHNYCAHLCYKRHFCCFITTASHKGACRGSHLEAVLRVAQLAFIYCVNSFVHYRRCHPPLAQHP